MSPIETWATAIFCRSSALVFGRRLLPLSFAHLLCLRALECNPIYGDDEPHQMAIAVCICSRTYKQIMNDIFSNSKIAEKEIAKIGKSILSYDVDHEKKNLVQYFENGGICPEHWVPAEKNSDSVKAPWELHVVRVLCHIYGLSFDQAMNYPDAAGRSLYDVDAQVRGSDSLKTDEEYAAECKLRMLS